MCELDTNIFLLAIYLYSLLLCTIFVLLSILWNAQRHKWNVYLFIYKGFFLSVSISIKSYKALKSHFSFCRIRCWIIFLKNFYFWLEPLPIFKSDHKSDLLCCTLSTNYSKGFWVVLFFTSTNIIYNAGEYGFHKKWTTTTKVAVYQDYPANNLKSGLQIDVLYYSWNWMPWELAEVLLSCLTPTYQIASSLLAFVVVYPVGFPHWSTLTFNFSLFFNDVVGSSSFF